ncbi:siderophore ferric iron reductase [Pseudomonas duriflava]|uniref:Siderophore ferric iron reductase n=1 Tax=Pseudomonas duriflava TaxID=459528 RepID=A0A562Q9L2_9PSED|nr:siderophore ferric iron reductase [Pseudomonas duriflava]TWI52716.1 siderophore ferric iron reductase [Pseudomonas duriflava]
MTIQVKTDLIRLLDLTALSLPGLNGRIGHAGPNDLTCGAAENEARLQALLEHWQTAYPEAGPHYWSARCWTLTIWQPIYLSILGVHLGGCAPSLANMGQCVTNGFVAGFCLPDHCPRVAKQDDLICFAGEQLRDLCERQLEEVSTVLKISPKMARRLQADYVLAALLFIQKNQRDRVSNERLRELEGLWLHVLGLEGHSELISITLDDGCERLALGRKVCCQHFRRADGELCSTCPKLKQEERIARLRQELTLDAATE